MTSRGRNVLFVILVLLAAWPPAATAAMQDDERGPDLAAVTQTVTDCSFLVRFDEDPRPALGDIACGVLNVPENWREGDGRRIDIRYAVLKSESDDPLPDPVVYLEGGPGGSALTGIEARAEFFSDMRQTRDIVLFDQRGTRLSTPLRCQAYSVDQAFQGGEAPSDPDEATEPRDVSRGETAEPEEAFEILQRARRTAAPAAAACAEEIMARGVDLRQYTSIASANDTVALVKALGFERYNLYGISYGTRLALVIMRDHPESGIRSVVLDSTFSPEIKGFERYPEEPHEVVIQLFADCALDPACNEAYPNLKARFIALLPMLREVPVVTSEGIEIDDRDLIEIMQGLAQHVEAVPYVPAMIAELEQGEDATFVGIATGSLFDKAPIDDAGATEEAEQAAATAGTAAAEIDANLVADASPARLFLLTLQAQIEPLPEDESGELFSLLLHLEEQAPDREALADFVGRAFPDADGANERDELLGLLEALSDSDVREVFGILEQTVTLFDFLTFGLSQPQFNSVECNEEIPFQAFDETVATAGRLEIPEMAQGVLEVMAAQFAICEVWPSGRAPLIESMPVTSDVPTLIFSGAYDLQTPVSWNKSAFVTLPNGTFVEFPMSGHGVITFSACAERVASAFVADPVAILDVSCTADLRPDWVLAPALSPASETAATPVVG